MQSVISELKSLNPGAEPVLLAFSGGVDSRVLFDLLLKAKLPFAVAHVNFQLRGAESEQDEQFVRELCRREKVRANIKRCAAQAYADEKGLSTQMAARDLRYAYFEELMNREGYAKLLTAHHRNDALETFLINLSRGSGWQGLQGIRESAKIIRPLLHISRAEIEEYAQAQELRWREDASNASDKYLRNRIRHKLISQLKESLPGVSVGAQKSFRWMGEQQQALDFFLGQILERDSEDADEGLKLAYRRHFKQAYWPALLRHWLAPYGDFDWEPLKNLAEGQTGRVFETERFLLRQEREWLILQSKGVDTKTSKQYLIAQKDRKINEPIALQMDLLPASALKPIPKGADSAALDYERLQFPLALRRWQAGDSFQPLGLRGHKKLSDFFIDQKMSLAEKEQQWLLCSGKDIVWVVGRRIDERYRLRDSTKTVYFVRLANSS